MNAIPLYHLPSQSSGRTPADPRVHGRRRGWAAALVVALTTITGLLGAGAAADAQAAETPEPSETVGNDTDVDAELEAPGDGQPEAEHEGPDDLPTEVGPPEVQSGPVGPVDIDLPTEVGPPEVQSGPTEVDPANESESAAPNRPPLPAIATGAECEGIEATIVGTAGDDVLIGTDERDVIFAGPGDDIIRGGAGDDIICGAGGNDIINGGSGFDWILGGSGADRLRGDAGSDMLRGGPGDDRLAGGPNRDVLIGNTGTDVCIGGQANDRADRCEETRGVQTLDQRAHAALEVLMTERINLLRTAAPSFEAPSDVSAPARPVKRVGLDKELEAVSESLAVQLIAAKNREGDLSPDLDVALGPDPDRNAAGQIVFVACGPHRRADLVNQLFFVALADGPTFASIIVPDFDDIGLAVVRGNGCWYVVATFAGHAN